MSLDVYLNRELGPEEWSPCYHCNGTGKLGADPEVYSANITHNLGAMADAAGIYEALWRPEEIAVTHARQLIEPLRAGLEKLRSDPAAFEKYNATNGWGLYKHFVPFVEKYLRACEENPDSMVKVSR